MVLAVGYCRRFHPSVVALRRHLEEGRLGSVWLDGRAAHDEHRAVHRPGQLARRAGGGAGRRADRGRRARARSHDRVRRPVRDVRCVTGRHLAGPSDDTTTVMLRFENGATGLIFCSVATATNFSFTLYGTRGLAEISRPDLERFRFVPGSTQAPRGPVMAPPDEISEHPDFDMLNAELTEFARCIRDRAAATRCRSPTYCTGCPSSTLSCDRRAATVSSRSSRDGQGRVSNPPDRCRFTARRTRVTRLRVELSAMRRAG